MLFVPFVASLCNRYDEAILLQPSSPVCSCKLWANNGGSYAWNKNSATAGKFFAFKEMGQKAEACFTFVCKFSLK